MLKWEWPNTLSSWAFTGRDRGTDAYRGFLSGNRRRPMSRNDSSAGINSGDEDVYLDESQGGRGDGGEAWELRDVDSRV